MISKYERKIMNKLLDKYEKSKSFIGENKVKQSFRVKVSTLFPKYTDHSNYELFQGVNEAVDILVRKSFVSAKANSAHVYSDVNLNIDELKNIYKYLGRRPKAETNRLVLDLLSNYEGKNQMLRRYCESQYERIDSNKGIEFFNGDLVELERILIAVDELFKVNVETFVRDFSIRIFKDSKIFEGIASKVVNLLYKFGEFPEQEQVLASLNIVKNPTYVNFKGAGSIVIKGQIIDLTELSGDIAISSAMLSDIESIDIVGKGLMTIENLTSFHKFNDDDIFAIYLGGYHNEIRREFIKKIYQQNPDIEFNHFGDIDAGGFYILEHLKQETGVEFKAFKMDVETLERYSTYTKKLTVNDRSRLSRLVESEHDQVINYMLKNNCKLEQEAVDSEQ